MKEIFDSMEKVIKHLKSIHETFCDENSFSEEEKLDHKLYCENVDKLNEKLDRLSFYGQLYSQNGRQMILADFLEYVLIARGYYCMKSEEDKSEFIKSILYFVNVLMSYEAITVSYNLRKNYLDKLGKEVAEIKEEAYYGELMEFRGKIGLKTGETEGSLYLNKYFDSLLPKTAGGLWHELLVYVFLLRNNLGYIIPLILSQRLMGLKESLVPPDFLIISYDKRIYGIEVGTKKEIQSGSFSLQTAIPTATIDTINSRVSDRCPICKRWIPFCDYVINNYADFNKEINKPEVRCLDECNLFDKHDISSGKCLYTKYSRKQATRLSFTHHTYATGLHYHYRCVLESLSDDERNGLINAYDRIALKTHYPYYTGLEELMK